MENGKWQMGSGKWEALHSSLFICDSAQQWQSSEECVAKDVILFGRIRTSVAHIIRRNERLVKAKFC